jgi:hypothetical protein
LEKCTHVKKKLWGLALCACLLVDLSFPVFFAFLGFLIAFLFPSLSLPWPRLGAIVNVDFGENVFSCFETKVPWSALRGLVAAKLEKMPQRGKRDDERNRRA